MESEQQIFFHVGLSKTGSTFLQHRIFPKIKGLHYVPTIKYHRIYTHLPKIKAGKILVSREFDQQFEDEVRKFSSVYPQACPIIVFREPSSWAVSNYKRFVKNGHPISFTEFIDVHHDKGLFQIKDFDYPRYLYLLEQYFTEKPLVLFYEELKKNPVSFLTKITDYTQTELDMNQVDLSPSHVSYSEKALKCVHAVSSKIYFQKKLEIHRKPLGFLYNLYANAVRYSLLYTAPLLPEKLIPEKPLYTEEEVQEVRDYFAEDWREIQEKYRETKSNL